MAGLPTLVPLALALVAEQTQAAEGLALQPDRCAQIGQGVAKGFEEEMKKTPGLKFNKLASSGDMNSVLMNAVATQQPQRPAQPRRRGRGEQEWPVPR
jgi:hypothetical protein